MNRESAAHSGTFLFVMPWAPDHIGGVNQVVINLYREIEGSGPLQPLILVLDWTCATPEERVDAGCRSLHLRIAQPPTSHRRFLRELLSYAVRLPSTLRRLRWIIRRNDVRVVSAQYPDLQALNFVLLKKLGIFRGRLLLSFHGLDIRNAAACTGLKKRLWRLLARTADAIVFCGNDLSAQLSSLDPESKLRPHTVRNGVDMKRLLAEMQQAADVTSLLPRTRFILNVAAFEHKKGQDVLLRAFARMLADFADVDLVMIGQDGPMREKISKRVSELGLEGRVRLILNLPHPQILECFRRASVFALPSRAEGLPIALLEAGALGVPVVVSRVDGNREVIDSEEVGLLFESEDDHGLESALRRLLSDDALCDRLGRNLQSRIATEFTWQKAWKNYLALVA
jgi:glycosyltransferase involved in cell wall biosynthesis